jgi:Tol biopolymer transport system component
MPLVLGTKLGPYEIVAPLGAGGMGEVYRARDTRLDRSVAIKILPAQFSSDPVRKQRFEREAKTISSLNHPHICVLHDVGSQDGVDYLVMECVEGETLAKRLEKGPLPVEQVLKYGAQIGDALDKAHRSGIVHRDLKPGNIMLTPAGAKLLDFGLAKPTAPLTSVATLTAAVTQSSPMTEQGAIVGTFQYMSPEQVEGKELDGRSDIFSLGAVLYEMLTGQRAFQGKSQLSVASAILEKEPAPINTIKPMTPPTLDHAIRRCLAKEPEKRWQSAADLAGELQWIAEAGSQAGMQAPVVMHRKVRERLGWVAATFLALVAVAFAISFVLRAPKPPPEPTRLTAEIGAEANLVTDIGAAAIFSPDGRRLVFVAAGSDQKRRIYLRSMDQLQATALSGTDNARDPFFSPDGQWLGFFADGKLKKISVQGGAAVTLCDASSDRGGSWGEDGTIVFEADPRVPLSKVSSAGGSPQLLTPLDRQTGEITQRWPQMLPGGRAVLFTSSKTGGNYQDADIAVYSMDSGKRKSLQHGGFHARYLPSGHLVYVHEGTLFAVPFDLKRLEVTGQPIPVLEGVVTVPGNGGAQFSLSETGSLVYIAGRGGIVNNSVYWMDRQGQFTPLREIPADYYQPGFSPDGKRLAMGIFDGKSSAAVWVYEWDRDILTRLTFSDHDENNPVWTPDGQRITYTSHENGEFNLYWKRADGSGEALRLTKDKAVKYPFSWRPDGKVLAFSQLNPDTSWDIMTLAVEGDEKSGWKVGEPRPFLNTPFAERSPAFSPDGRWLAYTSDESRNYEVYVRPFPGPGGKWQISTGGGDHPKWSRNGKELLYCAGDNRIMVANYATSGDSFHAEKPQLWSPGQFNCSGFAVDFDLHPDGKRLAVLKAGGAGEVPKVDKVSFIFNFFDELRRKVPSGKN